MLLNILKSLVIILLFSAFCAAAAENIKIKICFPEDGDTVYSDDMHIIGGVGKDIPMEILVNDSSYKIDTYRKLDDQDTEGGTLFLFMQRVDLQEGMNTVKVKAGGQEKNIKVKYITSMKAYKDKKEEKTFFHMDENKKVCKNCHAFESNSDCVVCHKETDSGKFVHGPVAAGQCLQCHDKNNYLSPFQPISGKCLECHQEFAKTMFGSPVAHGPATAGYCNICHNPHSSGDKFLLKSKTNTLCNNCHTDKKSGVHVLSNFSGQSHPTSGFTIKGTEEKLSCASCHNPHYGESKPMFQGGTTDFFDLCAECHKEKF